MFKKSPARLTIKNREIRNFSEKIAQSMLRSHSILNNFFQKRLLLGEKIVLGLIHVLLKMLFLMRYSSCRRRGG